MVWDSTRLEIQSEAGRALDPKKLWSLHERVWKAAFASLGEDHKMALFYLDRNVTTQPTHPCMWFYPGPDLESVASPEAFVYSFPADEFKNPVYSYVPVHHWFRLGLATGRDEIARLFGRQGLEAKLPNFSEVLDTSTFLFAEVDGELRQLHEDGLHLLSEDGWLDGSSLPASVQQRLKSAWEAQRCGCRLCPRVRRWAQSARWQARREELVALHGDGAGLLDAMLRGVEGHASEVKAWLAKAGVQVVDRDLDAAKVLERHIGAASLPATEMLTSALRRKPKHRAALLEVFAHSMASSDHQVLRTLLAMRLEKRDVGPELVAAMEPALEQVCFEPSRSRLVSVLAKHLDWSAAGPRGRLEARIESEQAPVRHAATMLAVKAFEAAKAKLKPQLLPAILLALRSPDTRVVGRALEAPLRVKDLSDATLELLVALLARDLDADATLSLVRLFAVLDWKSPKKDAQVQIAARLFGSRYAKVRQRAAAAFLPPSFSSQAKQKPRVRDIFDALMRVAEQEFHPEFAAPLLGVFEVLPKGLRAELVGFVGNLDDGLVAKKVPKHPELEPLHLRTAVARAQGGGNLSLAGYSRTEALYNAGLVVAVIQQLDEAASVERVLERFERFVLVDVLEAGDEWLGVDGVPLATPEHLELGVNGAVRSKAAGFRGAGRAEDCERLEEFLAQQATRVLRYITVQGRVRAARWAVVLASGEQLASFVDELWVAWQEGRAAAGPLTLALIEAGRGALLTPALARWIDAHGSEHSRFVGIVLGVSSALNNARDLEASIALLDLAFAARPHADFLYNKACAHIRAERFEDVALALGESIMMLEENRDYARRDADFAAFLEHPTLAPLLAP